jgi:transaldolase
VNLFFYCKAVAPKCFKSAFSTYSGIIEFPAYLLLTINNKHAFTRLLISIEINIPNNQSDKLNKESFMLKKLDKLASRGQSIWYDNISRVLLDSGEMEKLIVNGVRGITSNPSIFENAIAKTTDYDKDILAAPKDASAESVYESLVFSDIGRAADLLRPVYNGTLGKDGYISLEVSPELAHNSDGTIEAARRYWQIVDRPNLMIKVPATPDGISAIRQLVAEGINVNVTLLFSTTAYEMVAEAYIEGLEARLEAGFDISDVHSVASFFVSRVDTVIDNQLDAMNKPALKGKAGISNAKIAYGKFQKIFNSPRWEKLVRAGANVQRPLWASTGTKNPDYPDTLYVDNLIGPDTVNTAPPKTYEAFIDHGKVDTTVVAVQRAGIEMGILKAAGISIEDVTDQLLTEGVQKFAKAFTSLLASVDKKRNILAATD